MDFAAETRATTVRAPGAPRAGALSSHQVKAAMVLLLLVNTINYMDRMVLNILAEPIKHDLGLADWQIGAMNGLAFASLYTILGIPIARLAERHNRPMIIAASIMAWSGFTSVCGFANSFVHLVMARIGVGIGEAGCTPAATSLIADYVPRERRASALAFFTMAAPLGGVVGISLGGIAADIFGWRWAFVGIGLLGMPLGILTAIFLVEPRKTLERVELLQTAPASSLMETLRYINRKRTFWLVTFASCGKVFIAYGHAAFTVSFLLRNHGTEIDQFAAALGLKPIGFLGLAMGLSIGLANILSALVGGRLSDHYGNKDIRAYATVPAIAVALQIPVLVAAFLVSGFVPAMLFLILNGALAAAWYGPSYAAVQGVVPSHMRATAVALFALVTTIVGLGVGPVALGLMSDVFATVAGLGPGEGLRWALLTSIGAYPISFLLFWRARRTIASDMEG